MIVLREKTTRLKTLGVVLAFAGGALVALDASTSGQAGQAWGDVVCTVSAFTYGVYTVALQKLVPNDDVCRCEVRGGVRRRQGWHAIRQT